MPNQLVIAKEIETKGGALFNPNMVGNWLEKKRHSFDLFDRIALDTTNLWATSTPGTDDAVAISEVQGGSCLITTGSADEDSCMMAKPIIYTADYEAIVEFQIKISDVSGTAVFVGFSDAKSEANQYIALDYGTVGADVYRSTADNAVGFVIDADHLTSSVMCCSVKATVDTTPVDTGVDWSDNEIRTLRVALDTSGNATFYINGESKAYIASAVTSSTLLCPTVQAMTRANDGSNTIYVYRYEAWQNPIVNS